MHTHISTLFVNGIYLKMIDNFDNESDEINKIFILNNLSHIFKNGTIKDKKLLLTYKIDDIFNDKILNRLRNSDDLIISTLKFLNVIIKFIHEMTYKNINEYSKIIIKLEESGANDLILNLMLTNNDDIDFEANKYLNYIL